MFHTVKDVIPIEDYSLIVEFDSGQSKVIDVKPLIASMPDFKELYGNRSLFETVRRVHDGYGVGWTDKMYLFCDFLWETEEKKKDK